MEPDNTIQRDEMEALQSIFMDEFILLNESPLTYELIVLAEPDDSAAEHGIKARLRIEYTSAYPNEIALVTPHVQHPLTIKDLEKIKEIVELCLNSLIGMPMIYEVCEKVKDYLIERKKETAKEIVEEEKSLADLKKAERNEMYSKTIKMDREITTFTPVTSENYAKWRLAFDKQIEDEMRGKSPLGKKEANIAEEIDKRPTGRQFFEIRKLQQLKNMTDQKEEKTRDGEGKEEVFYYDEEAFEDVGDVENVDLS